MFHLITFSEIYYKQNSIVFQSQNLPSNFAFALALLAWGFLFSFGGSFLDVGLLTFKGEPSVVLLLASVSLRMIQDPLPARPILLFKSITTRQYLKKKTFLKNKNIPIIDIIQLISLYNYIRNYMTDYLSAHERQNTYCCCIRLIKITSEYLLSNVVLK